MSCRTSLRPAQVSWMWGNEWLLEPATTARSSFHRATSTRIFQVLPTSARFHQPGPVGGLLRFEELA